MSDHPVLVKGTISAVLAMSVNMALILSLHIHDVVVALCIAIAVGILAGFATNVGMPGVH